MPVALWHISWIEGNATTFGISPASGVFCVRVPDGAESVVVETVGLSATLLDVVK